jgi:hypothetical protein
MKNKLHLLIAAALLLLAGRASAAVTRLPIMYKSDTLELTPTNILSSNFLQGAGILITKDAKGRLTFSTTGGGGGGASNAVATVQLDGATVTTGTTNLDFLNTGNVAFAAGGLGGTARVSASVSSSVTSGLHNAVGNLQGATGGLNAAVGNLQGATGGLNSAVATLQSATGGLHNAVGNLQGATGGLNTAVGNLQGATGGLNSAVSTLQGATGGLHNAVGNLQGATGGLNSAVSTLQGATGGLHNAVGNLQGATGGLNTAVANLQSTKADKDSPTFTGPVTISGSGGFLISGLGTNAGSGTNFPLDVGLGRLQWIAPTGAFNIPYSTNSSTNSLVGRGAEGTIFIDLRGRASHCFFSFNTNFTPLGVATTNNAWLKSNMLHAIDYFVGSRTNADTVIATGYNSNTNAP